MRPVLVNLPSKILFILALLLAVGSAVRDELNRRRDPTFRRSATPLWFVAAALALLKLRGGDFALDVFSHGWLPVPIHAYGVMLGTSLIVGWFVALRFAKEDGIPGETAGNIYMWTAVWSIIGARVLFVIVQWRTFESFTDIFRLDRGGLVAYGGMIGGFLASWYGCWRRGIPLLHWADVSAPSVALGTGITRIGCFLYGCDFGRRTDLPWGIAFPKGSPAWELHTEIKDLPMSAPWSYPVHPTQLYEMVVGFLLFALLLYVRKKRTFSGQVFLAWVIGYGILRPLIEILREDPQRGSILVPWLSTSEFVGIVATALGIALLVGLIRIHRREPDALKYWLHPTSPAVAKKRKRR